MPKRNERCPCGSGLKFKNCCLDESPTRVVRIDVQTHLYGLLREHSESVFTAIEFAQSTVIQALEQDETALQIRARKSINEPDILRDQAELIERASAVIIRLVNNCLKTLPHSKIFWFIFFRRVAPTILRTVLSQSTNSHKIPHEEIKLTPTVSETLGFLTGFIMDSDTPSAPLEFTKKYGISGIDFSSIGTDELSVLGTIIGYSLQIQQYQVAFRFINKGVPLNVLVNSKTSHTDQIAIQNYERRRESYSTLTGFSGMWFDPASLSTRDGWWTEWAMLRMNFPEGFQIQVEGNDQTLNSPWLIADYLEERHLPNISSSFSIVPPHIIPGNNGAAMCGLPLRAIFLAIPEKFFIAYSQSELSDFTFAIYLTLRKCLDIAALANSFECPVGAQVIPRSALTSLEGFRINSSDMAAMGVVRRSEGEWLRELWAALTTVWSREAREPTISQLRLRELLTLFTRRQGRPTWSNEPFLFL